MRIQLINVALLAGIGAAALAGCGSHAPTAPTSTTATSSSAAPHVHPAPPNAISVSPGGVTTKVDVPSEATESQYGQACHAAREWMDAQHADPKTLVEPYLKTLQQPGISSPGNFNTPWVDLTAAQQAGVIMAANQASRGECG
ncbi:MAG: lipoprotein LpqV [Mycobacterium sp.]